MIKTIIFDFGDVFINLDKEGILYNALNIFGIDSFPAAMLKTNALYEMGLITTDSFLKFYTNEFPHVSKKNMINLWNSILKDFPIHRLDFLNELSKQKDYKLILLSNTNTLHIDWIIEHVPFYEEFKNCFDAFYLSHEIHLRKPNRDIYEFVLNKNSIKPEECLFIDDTAENTDTAKSIGIHTWNINPKNEDVINLFTVNHHLF
jgi:putative hydrolase of the HAD superfamily